MFQIDALSRTPVYEQIVDQMERLVMNGLLAPGSQLPSVRSLSVQLAINPNTIQKAYTELDRRGVLVSVPGRGCFVREDMDAFFGRCRQQRLEAFGRLVTELKACGTPIQTLEEKLRESYGAVSHAGTGVSAFPEGEETLQ